MQPDPSTDVPTFIPDDLLAAFADEARLQVAASHWARSASEQVPADVVALAESSKAAKTPKTRRSAVTGLFILVSALGLLGWGALVGYWGWMAWTTGDMIWGGIAAVGGLVIPVGIVAVVQMLRTPDFRTPLDAHVRPARDYASSRAA